MQSPFNPGAFQKKQPAAAAKKESDAPYEVTGNASRDNIRKTLYEMFSADTAEASDKFSAADIAKNIEDALCEASDGDARSRTYRDKGRQIQMKLKGPRFADQRRQVMSGELTAETVCSDEWLNAKAAAPMQAAPAGAGRGRGMPGPALGRGRGGPPMPAMRGGRGAPGMPRPPGPGGAMPAFRPPVTAPAAPQEQEQQPVEKDEPAQVNEPQPEAMAQVEAAQPEPAAPQAPPVDEPTVTTEAPVEPKEPEEVKQEQPAAPVEDMSMPPVAQSATENNEEKEAPVAPKMPPRPAMPGAPRGMPMPRGGPMSRGGARPPMRPVGRPPVRGPPGPTLPSARPGSARSGSGGVSAPVTEAAPVEEPKEPEIQQEEKNEEQPEVVPAAPEKPEATDLPLQPRTEEQPSIEASKVELEFGDSTIIEPDQSKEDRAPTVAASLDDSMLSGRGSQAGSTGARKKKKTKKVKKKVVKKETEEAVLAAIEQAVIEETRVRQMVETPKKIEQPKPPVRPPTPEKMAPVIEVVADPNATQLTDIPRQMEPVIERQPIEPFQQRQKPKELTPAEMAALKAQKQKQVVAPLTQENLARTFNQESRLELDIETESIIMLDQSLISPAHAATAKQQAPALVAQQALLPQVAKSPLRDAEITRLEDQLASKKASISELQEKLLLSRSDLQLLQKKYDLLQEENARLKAQQPGHVSLQDQVELSRMQQEVQLLRDREHHTNARHQAEVTVLRDELEQSRRDREALRERCQKVFREAQTWRDRLERQMQSLIEQQNGSSAHDQGRMVNRAAHSQMAAAGTADYDQGKNLMLNDFDFSQIDSTNLAGNMSSINPNNQQDLQSALLEMRMKYEQQMQSQKKQLDQALGQLEQEQKNNVKYRQNHRMFADAMMTLENGSGHQMTRQPGEEADGDEEDDDDGPRGVGGSNLLAAVHLQQMAAGSGSNTNEFFINPYDEVEEECKQVNPASTAGGVDAELEVQQAVEPPAAGPNGFNVMGSSFPGHSQERSNVFENDEGTGGGTYLQQQLQQVNNAQQSQQQQEEESAAAAAAYHHTDALQFNEGGQQESGQNQVPARRKRNQTGKGEQRKEQQEGGRRRRNGDGLFGADDMSGEEDGDGSSEEEDEGQDVEEDDDESGDDDDDDEDGMGDESGSNFRDDSDGEDGDEGDDASDDQDSQDSFDGHPGDLGAGGDDIGRGGQVNSQSKRAADMGGLSSNQSTLLHISPAATIPSQNMLQGSNSQSRAPQVQSATATNSQRQTGSASTAGNSAPGNRVGQPFGYLSSASQAQQFGNGSSGASGHMHGSSVRGVYNQGSSSQNMQYPASTEDQMFGGIQMGSNTGDDQPGGFQQPAGSHANQSSLAGYLPAAGGQSQAAVHADMQHSAVVSQGTTGSGGVGGPPTFSSKAQNQRRNRRGNRQQNQQPSSGANGGSEGGMRMNASMAARRSSRQNNNNSRQGQGRQAVGARSAQQQNMTVPASSSTSGGQARPSGQQEGSSNQQITGAGEANSSYGAAGSTAQVAAASSLLSTGVGASSLFDGQAQSSQQTHSPTTQSQPQDNRGRPLRAYNRGRQQRNNQQQQQPVSSGGQGQTSGSSAATQQSSSLMTVHQQHQNSSQQQLGPEPVSLSQEREQNAAQRESALGGRYYPSSMSSQQRAQQQHMRGAGSGSAAELPPQNQGNSSQAVQQVINHQMNVPASTSSQLPGNGRQYPRGPQVQSSAIQGAAQQTSNSQSSMMPASTASHSGGGPTSSSNQATSQQYSNQASQQTAAAQRGLAYPGGHGSNQGGNNHQSAMAPHGGGGARQNMPQQQPSQSSTGVVHTVSFDSGSTQHMAVGEQSSTYQMMTGQGSSQNPRGGGPSGNANGQNSSQQRRMTGGGSGSGSGGGVPITQISSVSSPPSNNLNISQGQLMGMGSIHNQQRRATNESSHSQNQQNEHAGGTNNGAQSSSLLYQSQHAPNSDVSGPGAVGAPPSSQTQKQQLPAAQNISGRFNSGQGQTNGNMPTSSGGLGSSMSNSNQGGGSGSHLHHGQILSASNNSMSVNQGLGGSQQNPFSRQPDMAVPQNSNQQHQQMKNGLSDIMEEEKQSSSSQNQQQSLMTIQPSMFGAGTQASESRMNQQSSNQSQQNLGGLGGYFNSNQQMQMYGNQPQQTPAALKAQQKAAQGGVGGSRLMGQIHKPSQEQLVGGAATAGGAGGQGERGTTTGSAGGGRAGSAAQQRNNDSRKTSGANTPNKDGANTPTTHQSQAQFQNIQGRVQMLGGTQASSGGAGQAQLPSGHSAMDFNSAVTAGLNNHIVNNMGQGQMGGGISSSGGARSNNQQNSSAFGTGLMFPGDAASGAQQPNIVDQLAASAGGAGDNASLTTAALFDDFGDFGMSANAGQTQQVNNPFASSNPAAATQSSGINEVYGMGAGNNMADERDSQANVGYPTISNNMFDDDNGAP